MTEQPDVTPIPKPPPREKTPYRGLRRGKRLNPRSAKTIAAVPERDEVREAVFARDGRRCRLAPFFPDTPCGGRLTYHHVVKAGQGGAYTVENGITACVIHNDYIEDHPDEAKALGLTKTAPPVGGPLYRREPGPDARG
ncbi:MAG: hypothetical protein KGH75_00245 [Rhodospirillales bacterium]|nr:hypothetical protein [Rhodospirillales bacterium]